MTAIEPPRVIVQVDLTEEVRELVDARVAELLEQHESTGYFNSDDAAEYLACPVSRIHDAAGAGVLRGYKDGSRWLFTRAQLDEYVQNGGWRAPNPRKRRAA